MRENRTHGSEGGEDGVLLYPYQIQTGAGCLCGIRALATKAVQFRLVRLRDAEIANVPFMASADGMQC